MQAKTGHKGVLQPTAADIGDTYKQAWIRWERQRVGDDAIQSWVEVQRHAGGLYTSVSLLLGNANARQQ